MSRYSIFSLPDGRPSICFDGKIILETKAHDADALRLAKWVAEVLEVGLGNCRLELAAPDMLAALKDAQDEIEAWRRWAKPGEGPDKPVVTSYVLATIRAAIAKATGEGQ